MAGTIPLDLALGTVTSVAEIFGFGGHILSPKDLLHLIKGDADRTRSVADILDKSAKQRGLIGIKDPEIVASEYARVRDVIPLS